MGAKPQTAEQISEFSKNMAIAMPFVLHFARL